MSGFVVDASVVMSWALTDEAEGYADRVLESLQSASAYVPEIWPLEVANVLAVAERRKRITQKEALHFLGLLDDLPIEVYGRSHSGTARGLFLLAREHTLSAYDASYLDLAFRLGFPLASLDAGLRRAARSAGVEVWGQPE